MLCDISNGTVGIVLSSPLRIRGADGDIHGSYSLLRSLLVSGVGFLALFWLISTFGDDNGPAPPNTPSSPARRDATPRQALSMVVAVTLLASAAAAFALHHVRRTPLEADLGTFPHQIGRWQSMGQAISTQLRDLDFDAELSRRYVADDGGELQLIIGHYEAQGNNRELADYRVRTALFRGIDQETNREIDARRSFTEYLTGAHPNAYYVAYWGMSCATGCVSRLRSEVADGVELASGTEQAAAVSLSSARNVGRRNPFTWLMNDWQTSSTEHAGFPVLRCKPLIM